MQQAPAARFGESKVRERRRRLLISASAHRQFVDTLRNILRSPASKEADTGGGRNGLHTRQSFACLLSARLFAVAAGDVDGEAVIL